MSHVAHVIVPTQLIGCPASSKFDDFIMKSEQAHL
jgi:hypothetical protein